MSTWTDWNIAKFAVEHDDIVATDDRANFLRGYAELDLHAGLVVIVPSARRKDLFASILDQLEKANEPLIDRVIGIDAKGDVTVREWNASSREWSRVPATPQAVAFAGRTITSRNCLWIASLPATMRPVS